MLAKLIAYDPGVYMIDSNTKWNFFEICNALNSHHGNRWQITATDDFVYDQRMIDQHIKIPHLALRLDELRKKIFS
jgi:dTDP-4-dehydrorhamnose reductase